MKKLAAAFLLLVLNGAWLAARPEATLFYFTMVGVHLALGAAVAVAGGALLARRFRSLPVALRLAVAILAPGALAGLALLVTGATRPWRWLVTVHVSLVVAGTVILLAHLALRASRPVLAAVALTAVAMVAAGVAVARDRRDAPKRDRISNPLRTPLSMEEEGMGPKGPFFPSSARTNTGGIIPANFFLTSQTCARCHRDIYAQWSSSMHHFSSFNNQWYRKSIEYMQDTVGTKPSKWCAGCHDHAVFFNGRFDRPIKEQIDTVEAQAGLACTSCHSISSVHSSMGQGDFTIEYPPLHDLAASTNPVLSWVHDYLLKEAPRPHRETFLKNFHTQQAPEFCSSCHKVHLDVPVNQYRWFRGFNDYDNWQASGVSGEGARSFYYPAKPMKCVECHMPRVKSDDPAARDGMVRSHRFAAANTAVPFVNEDHEQLKLTQAFLQDGQISVDVFGLVRGGSPATAEGGPATKSEPRLASTFAQGEESGSLGTVAATSGPPAEVIAPIDRVGAHVRRGETVRLDVVVRTRKVGHFFPGGTVDAFDVWVELEAVDDKGRVLLHSGSVADGGKGPVDPAAHFYRSLQIDAHGNPINKRNAWMTRSVAYVRLIPPGAADTVHYRLQVPKDCGNTITLRAKVNYRKFSWWNTQFAFAGVRDPADPHPSVGPDHDDGKWVFTGDTSRVSGKVKKIPDIPITVMAHAEATLKVLDAGAIATERPLMDASVRERWNDYGIGLLLQGDIKAAEATFLKVTQMEPAYADGWVNVGRARLTEGNLAGAEEVLRAALTRNPDLAKTHFFLGLALKGTGRYDEALTHLRRAAELYPRDRVVLNQIGRTLFLQRKYKEAQDALARVLAVDPEDLQAHYNLMLCAQGAGDAAAADRERRLYERFKADEASQEITGPYRQLHAEDNNERQSIHEHGGAS